MLVLTRKIGESITITTDTGQVIQIHLLQQPPKSRQIKMGIEAPKSMHVLRTELIQKSRTHKAN